MDTIDLNPVHLQQWMTTGKSEELRPMMIQYLDRLETIRAMIAKYNTPAYITNVLMELYPEVTRYHCQRLIADAINFFYCNNEIKKEAWRNIYAEKLDNAALVCWNDNDMEGFRKLTESAMKARRLNEADKEDIPLNLLERKTVLYQIDAEKMGIKKVDRPVLGEWIDKLNLSVQETKRLKMDAGIENVEFEEINGTEPN
ncbi:MAG: hypothetical protein WCO63_16140 [Bacteroidota bacterium]